MKLAHLSDLHLGKRLNEMSLMEDQRHILRQILSVLDREQPDAVLIAGDIYDKAIPSAEAVQLFDDFLCALSERGLETFVISGNHDSPERIAFGGRVMLRGGIHLSPVYDGRVEPTLLQDEHGVVAVYMLPFVKPTHVRRCCPEEKIESYTDALRAALSRLPSEPGWRRVLVAHQFVTGAERSESEERSVGGLDNVDASVFDGFDYVALGHIHGPQNIGTQRLRYCGTPLKYSFSECGQEKSVTIVELGEPGELSVRTVALTPLRELRQLRGSFAELTDRGFVERQNRGDLYALTLTDEEDVPEAVARLRQDYPNLLTLSYDNARTRASGSLRAAQEQERKTPLELLEEFFLTQNERPMSEQQREYSRRLMEEIWEDRT